MGLRIRGIDRHDVDWALNEVLDEDSELRLVQRYAQKLQKRPATKLNVPLKYLLKSEGFSARAIQHYLDEQS